MSRLDSRQLEELVQATVELQNRPQQERRMRTVAFTAQVDERELAGLDSQTRTEIIDARWQHLNYQMATYIAENLSANQYQLLRVGRHQGRNPIYRHGVVTMTLTLEVGLVTESPFVDVMAVPLTYTYPYGQDRITTVRREDVVNVEREYGSRIAEELDIDFGPATTPPAPEPDPVPHKRHILIDKKDKQ